MTSCSSGLSTILVSVAVTIGVPALCGCGGDDETTDDTMGAADTAGTSDGETSAADDDPGCAEVRIGSVIYLPQCGDDDDGDDDDDAPTGSSGSSESGEDSSSGGEGDSSGTDGSGTDGSGTDGGEGSGSTGDA